MQEEIESEVESIASAIYMLCDPTTKSEALFCAKRLVEAGFRRQPARVLSEEKLIELWNDVRYELPANPHYKPDGINLFIKKILAAQTGETE